MFYPNPLPTSAFRTNDEVDAAINQDIYLVEQSGHLIKAKLCMRTSYNAWYNEDIPGNDEFKMIIIQEYNDDGDLTYHKYTRSLKDLNIGAAHNCHFMFGSYDDALEYSTQLKSNEAYIAEVAAHHERCRQLFADY